MSTKALSMLLTFNIVDALAIWDCSDPAIVFIVTENIMFRFEGEQFNLTKFKKRGGYCVAPALYLMADKIIESMDDTTVISLNNIKALLFHIKKIVVVPYTLKTFDYSDVGVFVKLIIETNLIIKEEREGGRSSIGNVYAKKYNTAQGFRKTGILAIPEPPWKKYKFDNKIIQLVSLKTLTVRNSVLFATDRSGFAVVLPLQGGNSVKSIHDAKIHRDK